MTAILDQVQALTVQPGDTIIVTPANRLPQSLAEELRDAIKGQHPGCLVVILPPGSDVTKLTAGREVAEDEVGTPDVQPLA